MGFFRFLFKAVLVIAVLIGIVLFAARFNDGPLEIIAVGELIAGELYRGPEPDWSFVKDLNTVEFQLLTPARSRTTWIMEADGRVFIPSGYMTTWWGKIWKKWPFEAVKDGRIVLRADGKRYLRTLVRRNYDEIPPAVFSELSRKYLQGNEIPGDAVTSGYMWVFELVPREP